MQTSRPDVSVAVTIPTGTGSAPSGLFWAVFDDADAVIAPWSAVPGGAWAGGVCTLTVPAGLNALPGGAIRAARVVRLRWDGGAGEASYVVVAETDLVIGVNSLVAYGQALVIASETTDMDEFEAAERDARIRALADAWRALVRLRFDIPKSDEDMSRVVDFPGADPGDLKKLSAARLLDLEPHFLDALRRAQVIEANELLRGDTVEARRERGLLSSTTGEVSQMYRSGKPIQLTVSPRTMRALRGYLVISPRLVRGA